MENADYISVPDFFKGKSVLITGVTGFIGQLILEKLLRSCPQVNQVYLLIRSRKNKTPKERMETILSNEMFSKLKTSTPDFAQKIVILDGDIKTSSLGLSNEDFETLVENVNVIIHSAATVRFNEHLRQAVEVNVLGTKRIISLAKKLRNLAAFIHVSTAYAFCCLSSKLEEKTYPVPYSADYIIHLIKETDDNLLEIMLPNILGQWPNTYTFTKAMAEKLVVEEASDLPLAIVRPSVVSATWREPVPGWSLNLNGPIGILCGTSTGVMRTALCKSDASQNVIPGDVVANMILAVAWFIGTRPRGVAQRDPMIFHATTEEDKCIPIASIVNSCYQCALAYPSKHVFRYPGGSLKKSRLMNKIAQVVDHIIPAHIADFLGWLTGENEISMRRLYKTIHVSLEVLEYFFEREWTFDKTNMYVVENAMSKSDKQNFYFDMSDIHLPTYWQTALISTRKYIFHEEYSTLPEARRKLEKLYYLSWVEKGLLGCIVYFVASQAATLCSFGLEHLQLFQRGIAGSEEADL